MYLPPLHLHLHGTSIHLHSLFYLIYASTPNKNLRMYLKIFTKDPWMLCLSSSSFDCPYACLDWCGLNNVFPLPLCWMYLRTLTNLFRKVFFPTSYHRLPAFPSPLPLANATTAMNVHPDTVLNTVLHNKHKAIPFILSYISLDTEVVNLQMEYIKQDIQDTTFD